MTYDDWITSIERLERVNDESVKKALLSEELNENLMSILEPKLIELIKSKFTKSINEIVRTIDEMELDRNSLDLTLSEFKRKVKFVYSLIDIKEISDDQRNVLDELIKTQTTNVYNILLSKIRGADSSGVYEQTIRNNMIKWS